MEKFDNTVLESTSKKGSLRYIGLRRKEGKPFDH